MNFEEVKAFLEQNKDNQEVKAYLQGLNQLTIEGVQKFLNENPDAKKWFDSEKDRHFSKGLETWKTNNLSKLIDEEIKRRFPEKDEKDIELAKLRQEFEKMKQEALRKDLTNKALKIAQEKGLPTEIIDYFVGEDEKTTNDNLMKLERIFNDAVNNIVQQRLKGTYQPPKNDKQLSQEEKIKAEISKYFNIK
jgi:arsenate reductase-like glutaredoxin family protein